MNWRKERCWWVLEHYWHRSRGGISLMVLLLLLSSVHAKQMEPQQRNFYFLSTVNDLKTADCNFKDNDILRLENDKSSASFFISSVLSSVSEWRLLYDPLAALFFEHPILCTKIAVFSTTSCLHFVTSATFWIKCWVIKIGPNTSNDVACLSKYNVAKNVVKLL